VVKGAGAAFAAPAPAAAIAAPDRIFAAIEAHNTASFQATRRNRLRFAPRWKLQFFRVRRAFRHARFIPSEIFLRCAGFISFTP